MKTTLYINPLLTEIGCYIFRDDNTIHEGILKNLETASKFPEILIHLIEMYDIEEVWCITGPGPFTLMRIITLSINAAIYTKNISVKSAHFFDLVQKDHIPIIEANPKEYLIRIGGEVVNIGKEFLPKGTYEGIISINSSTEGVKYIQYSDTRDGIVRIFSEKAYESRISPIYFKPPHITCSKP